MGDEERTAINAKLDMVLMLLEQVRMDRKECRAHCDATSSEVFGKVRDLSAVVNQMIGAKVNPYWVYAIIGIFGLVFGLLGGMRIGH